MNRNLSIRLLCMLFAIIILAVSCSEDSTTPTNNNDGGDDGGGGGGKAGYGIIFTKFTDLVEEIAPAVYTQPVAAPSDSMWNTGEHSLLNRVFSETEPMSVYANITNLDLYLAQISEMSSYIVDVDNAGDTIVVPADQQNVTVELVNLVSSTLLPAEYEQVFWFTSIDLDKVIKLEQTGANNPYSTHCGFTMTETSQTVLVYYTMSDGTFNESSLFYAHVNLIDSSIVIRGSFYKDFGNNTVTSWVYQIYTVEESNFGYRMSWYEDIDLSTFLGCIVGGGNKDDEFSLLYRQFEPADAAEWDSLVALDQIFDANYNLLPLPEWGLGTAVYEGDIFTNDAMPSALILSPWAN